MSSPVTDEQKNRVRRRLTFDSQGETYSTSDSIEQSNNTHTTTPGQLPPPEEPQHPILLSDQMTNEQHRKQKMEQWNFDFENEVPLPGSWEWVMVPRQRPVADHKDVVKSLEMEKDGCWDDRNV